MKERLDNFIIENRDNILDDIAKLVNIESFCGDREHDALIKARQAPEA